MIEKIKLSKFNGTICENLYCDLRYITSEKLGDVISLFDKISLTIDNKSWLKFRDLHYLENILNNGGFIIGCYVDNILVASGLCESPNGEYKDFLIEMNMNSDEINSTYVSGYVMVDPLYRGNSLHRILMNYRIKESILRDKKYIATAIATDNIFSLNTILKLGFEIKLSKENENGVVRNILVKNLCPIY